MKILDWIEEIICVFCTVVMTALVFANVLSRYVFHSSLSFSEEITTYLFVLLSMMGTAIAAKRRAHLGLSIITDAVGPKIHKALMVIGFGIATVFSAALFYYGILMVERHKLAVHGAAVAPLRFGAGQIKLYIDRPILSIRIPGALSSLCKVKITRGMLRLPHYTA